MTRYRAIQAAAEAAIPDLAECERVFGLVGSPFAVLARQARERIEAALTGDPAAGPPVA